MRTDERKTVEALIRFAVMEGWNLHCLDDTGEVFDLQSTSGESVLSLLGSVDDVRLCFAKVFDRRRRIAWVRLVFGNEPGVLIADHSDFSSPRFAPDLHTSWDKVMTQCNIVMDAISAARGC